MTPTDVLAIHRPTAILTDKGQAVAAVYRLLAALRALDPDARADVLGLLEMETSDTERPA